MRYLPIVYVPGFAGDGFGGGYYTEDPFYGFNVGSTYVRISSSGELVFRHFEGPLLRLMTDHDYRLSVRGGQRAWLSAQADGSVDPRSIWFHQYYDISASQRAINPDAFRIERAAEDLLALIELIRLKTGAPRVHLVAHSTGGLVCRSLVQKIIPEHYAGGPAKSRVATDFIDRLFTYATPHGGITPLDGAEPYDGTPAPLTEVRKDRMYQYLTPGSPGPMPEYWRPEEMPENIFPPSRIFSLIGTMADDSGLRRSSASEIDYRSDGRVPFERAYVPGSHHAFVHRSHGGRYGIVNSEEGYEYMRRFLLGDLEVQVQLIYLQLPEADDLIWQAEVEVALRGIPVMLEQRTISHLCPIFLFSGRSGSDSVSVPVPLVSMVYLADDLIEPSHLRWTLRLRILSLRERQGSEVYWDNIEGAAEFEDVLLIDLGEDERGHLTRVAWKSSVPGPLRDYHPVDPPLSDENLRDSSITFRFPPAARPIVGADAAVRLTTRAR